MISRCGIGAGKGRRDERIKKKKEKKIFSPGLWGCGPCWAASWTSHFCAAIGSAARLCCARGRVPPTARRRGREMERHYSPGRTWEATAIGMLGLLHLGEVLDAGRATGPSPPSWLRAAARDLPGYQAPRCCKACRKRCKAWDKVEFVLVTCKGCDSRNASFDQVLLLNL